ncbi:MAG: TlpA family protein disulfide reductase [bacterium]|nr:TlpA family protein disulfide reductase [bacterium]
MLRSRSFLPLLACLLLATGAVAGEPAERPVLAAAEFALADHAGKVVALDFWASWCKPCKASMPWLSRMQQQYGGQGLQIVAVSVDADEASMRSRLGDIDPGIIVVFDPKGELAAQYKLEGMPTTYLIDRAGKLVASHVGYRDADAGKREAEIAAMLKEGK